jgi:hypothetical protein
MKKALMVIAAVLAASPLASQASDRLRHLPDDSFSNVKVEPFSIDDMTSTTCLRYRKKQQKPLSFLLEVSPWGVLSSPDIEGFSTTGTVDSKTVTETIDGSGSWMPTIHLGVGVNTTVMDLDFLFGGGYMGNESFGSGFAEIAFNPRFRLGPYVRLGPFVSLMYVDDAEWHDESDIKLEGGTATRAGVSFAVGGRKVFFNLAVSYMDFAYDVDTSESEWTASATELDTSGWAMQMGIYCRF